MGSQTPKYALPYPLGTDRVMDGDNAIQALAERVEAVLTARKLPRCRIHTAASVSIPNNVTTQVSFAGGTVAYDTDTMADIANSRITIKTAGWYVLKAFVPWLSAGTGFRVALLQSSGGVGQYAGQDYRMAVTGAITTHMIASDPLQLAVNDAVILRALHTQGTALNLGAANGVNPWISAEWYDGN
jgi:hypothetical protein